MRTAPSAAHDDRLLVRAEVVGGHVRDVRLRVGRPRAHRVRVLAGVLLDRRRRPAVGVALAQHRVHGAALDLVVAGAHVVLFVGLRIVGIVGHARSPCACSSAMASFSCGIDALMFGSLMMFASGVLASSPSSASASPTRCSAVERLGERREDPSGDSEMSRVSTFDAGGAGVGLDDREERVRREQRRLVGERVDDRRVRHRNHATERIASVPLCRSSSCGGSGEVARRRATRPCRGRRPRPARRPAVGHPRLDHRQGPHGATRAAAVVRFGASDPERRRQPDARPTVHTDLSAWLGYAVELVRAAPGVARHLREPARLRTRRRTGSSGRAPKACSTTRQRTRVSLVSTATLRDWDLRRFRTNVIVDGDGEDAFVGQRVRSAASTADVTKSIDRCVMTTRPQPGVDRDLDVLRTINHERAGNLGVGCVVTSPGTIAVGDAVVVV